MLRVIVRLMKILTALLAPEWLWRAEVLLELPLSPVGGSLACCWHRRGVRWCTVKGLLNTVALVALLGC